MAVKKAGGSTKNGRQSQRKRLGVKVFGSQFVKAGGIIVRQKGNQFYNGKNTCIGKDFTIASVINGYVVFSKKDNRKVINVVENL